MKGTSDVQVTSPAGEPLAEKHWYGLLAEFQEPEQLVHAAQQATSAGYRRMEAYSPFPIAGLAEALGFHSTRLPIVVLVGGILGGLAGYALQYWVSVLENPLNVGGRPLHSWPLFIPVTFECVVLGASLACVLGMLALNGLPRPHHPLFGVPGFEHASTDRFFLCIQARDAQFDPQATRNFLQGLGPAKVSDVEF
jgi:hypothetical protein